MEINNSTFEGVKFSYNQTIDNITLTRFNIIAAGTYGLNFDNVYDQLCRSNLRSVRRTEQS